MMQSGEPMNMGSPIGSPSSPGSTSVLNQSNFLPSFLMGEPSPLNSTRAWPHTSPQKSRAVSRSVSFHHFSSSSGNYHPRLNQTREFNNSRSKDKTGAPPVGGLLEDMASPNPSEMINKSLSRNASCLSMSFAGDRYQEVSGIQSNSCLNTSVANNSIIGHSRKNPTTPAQIDPFFTQGESLLPDDELDETWITIYGFPSAAKSFILQQFSQYGNIVRHNVATDGNWLHVKYQSKLQAKKALSKNGKVFGSSIMVGVRPCIDKDIMETDKENISMLNSSMHSMNTSLHDFPSKKKAIRPLTASFRVAKSENEVEKKNRMPQKNNNPFSKAMEYMFGW